MCTPAFDLIPQKWYAFCPQAIASNCGGYKKLFGLQEVQTWGRANMRYQIPYI